MSASKVEIVTKWEGEAERNRDCVRERVGGKWKHIGEVRATKDSREIIDVKNERKKCCDVICIM